jgi:hypothetical protein
MESKAQHREIPKEEATVKSSGAMKKQHRGWHLAAGHHGKPKELALRILWIQRKLAAACRKMTCRAVVAWCRGHGCKVYDQISVVQGTRKGWTFGKRWKGPECNSGIRDRGLRQQLQGSKLIKNLVGGWPLYLRKNRTTTDGIGGCSSGQRAPLGSRGTLKKTLYEIVSMMTAKQKPDLTSHHKKSSTGHCGGVGPLQSRKGGCTT